MRTHDAVIVGAGPAGSALAIRLARAGCDVLLLEKDRFPRDKVCGDLVSAKGLRLLEDLGCYDSIQRRGFSPIQESLVYLDGQLLARGALPKLPGHPPFAHAVPRSELDDTIFGQARLAGARCVEGCRVREFEIGASGVTVRAEVEGRREQFCGRIIVGADGAASIVARGAGLEMRDARYVQLAIRAYASGWALRQAILYFQEDYFPGFGWVFPITETVSNIGVGMVKESLAKDGIRLRAFFDHFARFVKQKAREAGAEIELTRPAGWPITTYGGAGRNYFERGLLIGDAGCFVDPISGEGIPLALETAEMAAETIQEALAAEDFSAERLAGYERRWRAHFDPDLGVSDLVVSMIRNRHLAKVWLQWLRIMGMTADRDPEYARKTGGILAGLVPNREGFGLDVIRKSIVHGPAFWMEALDLSAGNLPADLVLLSNKAFQVQTGFAKALASDLDWFRQWAAEIGVKQARVFAELARRGLG